MTTVVKFIATSPLVKFIAISPLWLNFCIRNPTNFLSTSLTTEINNLKIFLTIWSLEKHILLLLPVDYDISPLLIFNYLVSRNIIIHWYQKEKLNVFVNSCN